MLKLMKDEHTGVYYLEFDEITLYFASRKAEDLSGWSIINNEGEVLHQTSTWEDVNDIGFIVNDIESLYFYLSSYLDDDTIMRTVDTVMECCL